MDDSNKKQFWLMMNVAMELTGKPSLTKEAIVTWWHMLSKYEFVQVEKAIDEWCRTMSKAPTPSDILKLCAHKPTIFARLPSPLAIADNHRHAVEVKEAVAVMTKGRKDMKLWARKIVDGSFKSNAPDLALKYAKEALQYES